MTHSAIIVPSTLTLPRPNARRGGRDGNSCGWSEMKRSERSNDRRGVALTPFLVLGLSMGLASCAGESRAPPLAEAPAAEEPEFEPGVRQVGEGKYEVNLMAYQWGYEPKDIRVPVGAEVTIRGTSGDLPHGVVLAGAAVWVVLEPGRVSETTHTFTEPGEYQFVCDQYCGAGHAEMLAKIIVE